MDIRTAYLGAAATAVDLIGSKAVGDRWNEPSALTGFTVRGLSGHLARAVLQVEWCIDADEPPGPPITAVEYYGDLEGLDDPASELSQGVIARGDEAAAGGWARLYLDTTNALDRLRPRLPEVPQQRLVLVTGRAIGIDEYLKTRLIELAVHVDDLAASVGVPSPRLPEVATTAAIAVLVGVARARHGDTAVLRALARRERDEVRALRVL